MTVPGFPNFVMLYGPNTNLGHNSIIYMLESQVQHLMPCRAAMRAAGTDERRRSARFSPHLLVKPLNGPPFGARTQRRVVGQLAPPATVEEGALLFLHGGAFCPASPRSHRSISLRLARDAGMPVWVPDYRLAPEHPYPAALGDALACYDALLASGITAQRIVLADDSAGAAASEHATH